MDPITRLKEVISILKNTDGDLTNEVISNILGYRTKTYLSDILGKSKPINKIFLEKLHKEFDVNPTYILSGEGRKFVEYSTFLEDKLSAIIPKIKNYGKSAADLEREEIEAAREIDEEDLDEATDLGAAKATYENKSGTKFIELSGGQYIMNTPLINKKAYAGYLSGWGDDEYISELPTHPITVDKPHLGYYRSFEVAGDSMDDGTARSIQNGDIVTGRKIDRSLWKSKLHLSKFSEYIIVSLEGILVKEIIKHDTGAEVITCHSLNPDKDTYPDFELPLAKVIQLFNVVQVTKKR